MNLWKINQCFKGVEKRLYLALHSGVSWHVQQKLMEFHAHSLTLKSCYKLLFLLFMSQIFFWRLVSSLWMWRCFSKMIWVIAGTIGRSRGNPFPVQILFMKPVPVLLGPLCAFVSHISSCNSLSRRDEQGHTGSQIVCWDREGREKKENFSDLRKPRSMQLIECIKNNQQISQAYFASHFLLIHSMDSNEQILVPSL